MADGVHSVRDGKAARAATLCMVVGLFLIVRAGRWIAIERFASDVPMWDQWGAEADGIIRPWLERRELIAPLLAQHSEHRIAPTRLLNLLLAVGGGQWDARVEC